MYTPLSGAFEDDTAGSEAQKRAEIFPYFHNLWVLYTSEHSGYHWYNKIETSTSLPWDPVTFDDCTLISYSVSLKARILEFTSQYAF